MVMHRNLLLLAPVLALGGCALLEPKEDPNSARLDELERRMQAIERVVQGQTLVNMTQQVAAVERQGDEIQGRVETLEHNSETTAERQRQLYADLDARIQELESALSARNAMGVMEGGTLAPGQLPMPGGSDRDNYQAALQLIRDERYEQAGMAFKQFLETYPDSQWAGNAQYWLAESYYVTEKFSEALAEFEAVITAYPRSTKVPDAHLKMGYCNYELKSWDAARASLTRVQADYPETTAARLAGQRLKRMEEEGV